MQEETQQFSQMDTKGKLTVWIATLYNVHYKIQFNSNIQSIYLTVGYGVQAGPNNGQQTKGKKVLKRK